MKKFIAIPIAIILSFGCFSISAAEAPNAEQAKKVMMSYGKALQTEMKKAMKAGGPVNAVNFCNIEEPRITADAAKASGWDISRTSLKLRNTANQPDAWELKVLKDFEKRKSAGEKIKTIAYSEVIEHDGKKTFRFMKAIPTGDVCLMCHADKISADVEAKINALYPQDKARGYVAGDIRGAFSLSKSY